MPEKEIMDYVWQLARAARRGRGKRGEEGVSRSVFRVLRTLEKEGPLRAGELADHLDIRLASLTEQLDKMEGAGFIQRAKDPADLRVVRVSLTERGKQELEEAGRRRKERNAKVEQVLSLEERQQFIQVAEKLIAFLEGEGA